MGDEAAIGPPDELQGPPTLEGSTAGIEIRGKPQPSEAEGSSSNHSGRPVQQQSSAETDWQAEECSGAVVCAALGQGLIGRGELRLRWSQRRAVRQNERTGD